MSSPFMAWAMRQAGHEGGAVVGKGVCRIVYEIQDDVLKVVRVKIGHRREG